MNISELGQKKEVMEPKAFMEAEKEMGEARLRTVLGENWAKRGQPPGLWTTC